jgi:hypothetical protein
MPDPCILNKPPLPRSLSQPLSESVMPGLIYSVRRRRHIVGWRHCSVGGDPSDSPSSAQFPRAVDRSAHSPPHVRTDATSEIP